MTYALDNDSKEGADHLTGLSGLFDRFTTARIGDLLDLYGKRCLEVGAGAGSVAYWMAERVGGTGEVWATDIKTSHIPAHPRMTVLTHDLQTEPLPVTGLDLIHARLVLAHLPEREAILDRLVAALAPGGLLLVEEWDGTRGIGGVLHAPSVELADLYTRYIKRRGELFGAAGTNRTFAPSVHARLLDAGLTEVHTIVHAESWQGGSPGSRHARATFRQFGPRLLDSGFTGEELASIDALLDDPRLHVGSYPLFSTSGRR
jgi:SAM-dependent methyltransferase